MQNTIFVIMVIIKAKLRTGYDDVTKEGNVPLYDLRKYKNKIKGHSETLYKKIGVVTKTSIRCKALDASPMFSALFSNAILSISS